MFGMLPQDSEHVNVANHIKIELLLTSNYVAMNFKIHQD